MIVLDASVCIEWALHTPVGEHVAQWLAQHSALCAPQLIDLEVAQVLRRFVVRGEVSYERATAALAHFSALDIQRYDHAPLLPRIWELRANLTAYDAAYVALAEILTATLLTADERLASASGHLARVQTITL